MPRYDLELGLPPQLQVPRLGSFGIAMSITGTDANIASRARFAALGGPRSAAPESAITAYPVEACIAMSRPPSGGGAVRQAAAAWAPGQPLLMG